MQQKSQVYLFLIGDGRLDGNNFETYFIFILMRSKELTTVLTVSVTQSVTSIAFLHQYLNCNRFSIL